ncbi:MAG TPA: hypothetical protein DIU15_10650 [Deltaproteobacteria bacterium]|nr:hypothetical protein [Deltaproteobacteria bacterium]HCP46495.1 hypothetical protein [Deltaproteobacteria bacterium]
MIAGFRSAVLFCTDTETARRWYETAGFKYLRGYEGMHWFALGTSEIMLHPSTEGPSGAVPELHLGVDDIEEMFRHAQAQGLEPHDHQQPGVPLPGPVTRPWGAVEFELEDPDGHRWAFTQLDP